MTKNIKKKTKNSHIEWTKSLKRLFLQRIWEDRINWWFAPFSTHIFEPIFTMTCWNSISCLMTNLTSYILSIRWTDLLLIHGTSWKWTILLSVQLKSIKKQQMKKIIACVEASEIKIYLWNFRYKFKTSVSWTQLVEVDNFWIMAPN